MITVNGEFIQRGETTYADIVNGDERALHGLGDEPTPVAFWAAQSFHPRGMRYSTPKREARGSVVARIDHGRWVVDCPARRCCAAQVAAETDPRFFCHQCFNAGYDGAWLPVVWPDVGTRTEIETLLLLRPEPEQRNWRPGETVEMVRAENVEHGCSTRTEG